jgi:hypothetical protein
MNRKLGLLSLSLVMAASVAVTGCDDDEPDPITPTPEKASIRVVHASPDAPAVDIYAEGVTAPLIKNLAYGQASAYLSVDAGSYNIQIRAAGAPATSAPAFSTGALSLPGKAKITAVAAGFLASTAAEDKFRVLPLAESFGAPGESATRVRIVHASPNAPTVAVDVGNDGNPEVASLARFADTGAAGVDLPSATALQIGIWAGNPLGRVTAFTTPELPAGAELFVIATGSLTAKPRAADGFGLLAVGPAGVVGLIRQNPVVYALHGSPDAPAVDLFAGNAELSDDLAFGEMSGAVQVPPGAYAIDFFAHAAGSTRPAGAPAATLTTPTLAAGERYLAIATGFLAPQAGAPAFQLLAKGDEFASSATTPLVRFVHSSPDTPAVDVGTISGATFTPVDAWKNIAFRSSSVGAGTQVPVGAVEVGAGAAGSGTALISFDLTMAQGLEAFAIAIGSFGGGTLRLAVVNAGAWPWTSAVVLPKAN